VSPAADDVRVQEARRRIAALPHDTELIGLGQAELVAWVARMHGAAHMLDAFVRDADAPREAGDSQRLGESRAALAAFDEVARILAAFDWEHDDRQLALEAIERAVLTGQGQDDGQDQSDEPEDNHWTDYNYTCSTCGAQIGMFIGREGWHHYRGDGTAASPVEIYDAGHEATFAKGLGGVS